MSNLCHKCFFEYDTPGSCPRCGYDATAELGKYPLALRPGSILGGRYIVGRVLGEGGFGITYSAQDYDSKDLVAIKEHFPAAIVTRTGHSSISLISESMKDAFLEGKQKFLDEAQTLSQFNGLDNICDIYSYFEENGTAYFAMEYVNGIPLDEFIKKLGRVLSFEEAARLLLPVMDALSHVHEKGIIHRDISPDNIMVSPEGKVMLIDFGAARYSMGEKSRSLDVILKHGFAPMEQYNRHGRQGAYTDVYAMAATFYYSITGKVPQDALDRLYEDSLQPPSKLGIKIPKRAETALMKALTVHFNQRWQSMREFSEIIRKELPPSKAELEAKRRAEEERKAAERRAKNAAKSSKPKSKALYAIIAAIAALAIGVGAFFAMDNDTIAPEPAPVSETSLPSSGSAGKNILWELNENGTLIFSGDGPMANYSSASNTPWYADKDRIKSVEIPNGITSIGANAFNGCGELRSVRIPASVSSIGKSAFYGCYALSRVYFAGPQLQWEKINLAAYNDPLVFANINYSFNSADENSDDITWELEVSGVLCLNGKGPMVDYASASDAPWYRYRNDIEVVRISSGITSIGTNSFSGYSKLSSVSIPASVSSVGKSAFYGCYALNDVNYSGSQSQWKKIALEAYNDPLLATNISYGINKNSAVNKNITWELGDDGTLTLSGSGPMVDYAAASDAPWYEYKHKVKAVDISDGISSIGDNNFNGCHNLSTVNIPATVTTIGDYAFNKCLSLRRINYADTIVRWQNVKIRVGNSFNPSDIELVYVSTSSTSKTGSSWTLYSDGLLSISGNGTLYFPDVSSKSLWGAYRNSIKKVEISYGITSIKDDMFYECINLSSISIPSSVTRIGQNAFGGCASLSEVYFDGTKEQWNKIPKGRYNGALLEANINYNS